MSRMSEIHELLELADYCYGCAAATRPMSESWHDMYWEEAGHYLEDAMWTACLPGENDTPVRTV